MITRFLTERNKRRIRRFSASNRERRSGGNAPVTGRWMVKCGVYRMVCLNNGVCLSNIICCLQLELFKWHLCQRFGRAETEKPMKRPRKLAKVLG